MVLGVGLPIFEIVAVDLAHVHAAGYGEVEHFESPRIVLYIFMYALKCEIPLFVIFVEVEFIANIEEQFGKLALAKPYDTVLELSAFVIDEKLADDAGNAIDMVDLLDQLHLLVRLAVLQDLIDKHVELGGFAVVLVVREGKHGEELDDGLVGVALVAIL